MKNKILILITLVTSTFMGVANVSAGINDNSLVKNRYDGVYAVADLADRTHLYYAERYTMNGKTAYCTELGIAINSSIYSSTTDLSVANLSNDVLNYVKLVAYYGYDYSGHQTRNYYLAAQELIWEKTSGRTVKWVTEFNINGTELDISNEKNTIINLIDNHNKIPSFNEQTIEVNIGENKTITDTNGVLNSYEITKSSNNANLNGNNLTVSATDSRSNNKVTVTKKSYTNSAILIYYTGTGDQKMISAGRVDMPSATINIKTVGGSVNFDKLDQVTGNTPQGEATLIGAEYGVYNSSNQLVDKLVSGIRNTSKDLPYGDYVLQEIKASEGYQLDTTKYTFSINASNTDIKLDVYEQVINRDVELTKVYANDKTSIMKPELNITFGFYDRNGNLYTKGTTDQHGRLKVNLVYGSYTVRQLNSTTDYEKVEDFTINVKDMGDTFYYTISNAEITAKLKVIKVDSETGNIIPRANIKFKIFNVDTGKYVSQTITYPIAKTIDVFETDSNGILITPYPLQSGNFRLEEVDQVVDKYLWNQIPVEFHIGENSKLIVDNEYGILFEVKFENTPVKGSVTINKLGEEVELTDHGYVYHKINLKGVKIGIYANEDIYDGTGNLIYKKGTLVNELISDENGFASIDNIYLEKYYLQELETVNNHILDKTKYEFELKYKNQYTATIEYKTTIENHLPTGKLEFTKNDISTSAPLPNTTIEIYNDNDSLIYTGITNNDGKIVIDRLPIGRFYIIEKNAPEGYELNKDKMWFEITEDGQIVKCTMTDSKIKVEVPNTSKNEYMIFESIFGGLVIVGIGMIIYAEYKIKKINKKK